MTLNERTTIIGAVAGLIAFVTYLAVLITRAATDGLPLTEVAWHGPLLLTLLVGGGAYAVMYGVLAWRVRGQRTSDVRDREIMLYAETAGSSLTGLVVLAVLIMFGFKVDTFWIVHVLFVGSYLASVISASVTIAGYRKGIQS
jgi:hypothetical protein